MAEPPADSREQRAAAKALAAVVVLFRSLSFLFFGDEAEVDQTELVQGELLEGVQDAVVVLGALFRFSKSAGERKERR